MPDKCVSELSFAISDIDVKIIDMPISKCKGTEYCMRAQMLCEVYRGEEAQTLNKPPHQQWLMSSTKEGT